MTVLLHTADWHLGKTFYRFSEDPATQERLRQARFAAVERLGTIARERGAEGVLVAGDLFHSNQVDDRTVLQALDAIGRIDLPVIAIPGNHDHAGAGSLWERRAFREQAAQRAPKLVLVADRSQAVELGAVSVVAVPITARFQTVALHELAEVETPAGRPRVGLVHAATHEFGEAEGGRALVATGAERAGLAFLALGDYHRQQSVSGLGCPAWYAGCHEPDGFPSHHQDGERIGGAMLVEIDAGGAVEATPLTLPDGLRWVRIVEALHSAEELAGLEARLRALAAGRAGTTLCRLDLAGSVLGYAAHTRFEGLLEELRPAFETLEVEGAIALEPTDAELAELTALPGIAGVAAQRLYGSLEQAADDDPATRAALAHLHRLVLAREARP